jgi:hypothetical protein
MCCFFAAVLFAGPSYLGGYHNHQQVPGYTGP